MPTPAADSGRRMHDLASRLFPICRSLTGDGVRATLRSIGELVPLTIHEVPTGTKAFDWTVPKEWNIRDAYIKDRQGKRVIDFRASNLHVVNYSRPIRRTMALSELQQHLHSLPAQPELIPYRTTYYHEDWGFCLTQQQRDALHEGDYDVCVDSTLADGSLSYGECSLAGSSDEEVLIWTHVCHPSLANDNLSGVVVCTFLAQLLERMTRRYTYRVVFAPGTIGALVWLSRNHDRLPKIRHGLVAVQLGDSAPLRYKQSRRGDAEIDRAARHVLSCAGVEKPSQPFAPDGYDERQFGSPGINLPVGRLSRSPDGGYPQYHTSADNLDLLRPEALEGALAACAEIVGVLEANDRYLNAAPYGEPQLGRRGLYRTTGGEPLPGRELAMLWTLNLSDGSHSLLDIAERAGLDFRVIRAVADELKSAGLLIPA